MINCDSKFDVEVFGKNLPRISLKNRSVVFMRGDKGAEAFVVLKGAVQVRRSGLALEHVGPGCIVGEIEMLDPQPRAASAVAVGDAELAVIDRELFDRLCVDHPAFAARVIRVLAKRLASASNHDAEAIAAGGQERARLPVAPN